MDEGVLNRDVGESALRAAVKQTIEPLDPKDRELLDKVADQIVRRGLTVPAVFFLESSKPLSYVGSQALLFLEPFIRAFLDMESYSRFVRLLEDRDNYELLINVIEERDAELVRAKKEAERNAMGGGRGGSHGTNVAPGSGPHATESDAGKTSGWRGWLGKKR
ncbi:MAG: hypothetical protein R3E97_08035 [Candidatus Eisenbacteria bacterium]